MEDFVTRIEKIKQILEELKEPSFRLAQINKAIYRQKIDDYEKMLFLPQPLRKTLKEKLGEVLSLKFITETKSAQAKKVLFETRDGAKIEAVLMTFNPETNEAHESVCISSQSGCGLGCQFCSTGKMGFKKNLTVDEITSQVLFFRNRNNFSGSISFMGMGEPFANSDAVFKALQILTDKEGFNCSHRRINISTVGFISGIKKLSTEFPQVNLSFSLHFPTNNLRSKYMPINKIYPMVRVLDALDDHIQKNKRRVFLAYLLLNGINDSVQDANDLVDLIKSRGPLNYLYHVNLINFHTGDKSIPFQKAPHESLAKFANILKINGIAYSVRQSFGIEIAAACGQLAGE